MRVLARTFRRFLQYRRTLLAGIACIPLASLGDIGITITVGNALDRLRGASDAGFLRGMVVMLMGIALGRGVFRFLQRWWIVTVSRYVERDLKQELFDRLVTLSFAFHNRRAARATWSAA